MIKKITLLTVLVIQLFVIACLAKGSSSGYKVSFPRKGVMQGDAVVVMVTAPPGLTSLYGEFNNNAVYFNRSGEDNVFVGIIGIDMSLAPGMHYLSLNGNAGDEVVASKMVVHVRERKYGVEELNFSENWVELDKEIIERVNRETETLREIWKNVSSEKLWSGKFTLPVDGRLNSNFGRRRILNGKEKNPHNGVDISAPLKSVITSPNKGRVVLLDDHFFGGKSIVLDHGQGLYTTYLHLHEILVKEGDIVNKGDHIGRVGETGRAKGPHLHWGARINNARVDPLKLLDIQDGAVLQRE